jgi:TolB-like protein/tRNA A-37 threonylcarbamoyl transferase component Bud32/Flp pilus assembly protein TadD
LNAEERLVDLAASVADGKSVDWATAETDVGDRGRRLIGHLRLVSDVAELYRSLPESAAASLEPEAQPYSGPKWGRLVLLDRVGEGTSSEVYRAWDPELQREVALKLLKVDGSDAEAARWRLLGEARRLARVRHPHVVIVFGADRRDDRVGLWMELVKGVTLDEIVRRDGPLGAREAALVGLDLCGALAAVHAAGLAHRDLKAQNVMRETGGRIVLMDFGTGEELKQAEGSRLAGTPLYLAPEIFARKPASIASDLYSLGVLLFNLVTGKFPIAASTFEDLARAHQRREGRRLRDLRPDLPEAFVRVVERALTYDPALRYESAGGMEAALRQALDKTPVDVAPPPERPRRAWPWIAAAAAIVAAVGLTLTIVGRPGSTPPARVAREPATQIAVLPLVDLSGGSAPAYLADALTDRLIATLGQVRALRVTSRTSVLQFKGGTTPIRDIGQTLGVGTVFEGSINVGAPAASGERTVTVNARLIEASTDTQIWAETFRRRLGEALEADIARAIARAVRATLSPGEASRLDQRQTTNPAAAEAYFQGRYYLNQFGPDNFRRAVKAFERAIELDPNYAVPHVGLARAYLYLGSVSAISKAEARASALAAASRAVELDEATAEAHSELGDLKFYFDWDFKGADAAYNRAIELNPSLSRARVQHAQLLAAQDRAPDAVEEMRRAEEIDPLSVEVSQYLALMQYYARDYDGAVKQLQKALTLDARSPRTHVAISRVHEARGEWKEAIAATEHAIALSSGVVPPFQALLVRQYALSGNVSEARRRFSDLEKMTASAGVGLGSARLAYVHLTLGEDDQALSLLERAVADRDSDVLWIRVDPSVDRLRKLPRFEELSRRVGTTP